MTVAVPSVFVSLLSSLPNVGELRGYVTWPALKQAWSAPLPAGADVWTRLGVLGDRFEVPMVVAGDDLGNLSVFDGSDGTQLLTMKGPAYVNRIHLVRHSTAKLIAYVAFGAASGPGGRSAGGLLGLTIYKSNAGVVAFSRKWFTKEQVVDIAVGDTTILAAVVAFDGVGLGIGEVKAFDRASGDEVWRSTYHHELIADAKSFYAVRHSDDKLVCFDPLTGDARWTAAPPYPWAWNRNLVADETRIYVTGSHFVTAFHRDTGAMLWTRDFGTTCTTGDIVAFGSPSGVGPSPAVAVRISSSNAANQKVWAMDAATGKTVWVTSTSLWKDPFADAFYGAGLLGDTHLVYGTNVQNSYPEVAGVDLVTGAVDWKATIPDSMAYYIETPFHHDVSRRSVRFG